VGIDPSFVIAHETRLISVSTDCYHASQSLTKLLVDRTPLCSLEPLQVSRSAQIQQPDEAVGNAKKGRRDKKYRCDK
jgi:hypothetical protein